MCAFVHTLDYESLCQSVGIDETPLPPGKHPGASLDPVIGVVHSHPFAEMSERDKGTPDATGNGKTAATAPQPRATKQASGPSDSGLGASAPKSGDGLPKHLRCMMPPKEDTTYAQERSLESLVKEYEDIFIAPGGEVGYTDRIRHTIEVGEALPVKIPPRKTSFA